MKTQRFSQVLSLIGVQFEAQLDDRHRRTNVDGGAFRAFSGFVGGIAGSIITGGLLLLVAATPLAWTQDMSTGAVNVTVLDPSGAAVNGAQIALKDIETNDVHTATTKGDGNVVL